MTSMQATKIKNTVMEEVPLGVHIEQSGQPGFCT